MILIDMNQIAVANLMMNLKMNNSKTIDESMVRHMILNSIRMYRMEQRLKVLKIDYYFLTLVKNIIAHLVQMLR